LTCLTDGANNCWSITKTLKSHCKKLEQILDWFHVTKRFTVIRNSINDELKDSLDEVKWCLWHGNHQKALLKINELIAIVGTDKLTKLLQELSEYLERNKAYLVNYQEKASNSLPYTSTYAEVSVNSIINIRQKCNQKMQWSRQGAHDVLQLRTSIFSKIWKNDMNTVKMGLYKHAT
jgi:2-succinyl-5-enolpyruvyl-6-hydroxy-3-cyclohexene-1-carboxylate synthase